LNAGCAGIFQVEVYQHIQRSTCPSVLALLHVSVINSNASSINGKQLPAHSVSVDIYSGIARFPCDSTVPVISSPPFRKESQRLLNCAYERLVCRPGGAHHTSAAVSHNVKCACRIYLWVITCRTHNRLQGLYTQTLSSSLTAEKERTGCGKIATVL